MSTGTAWRKSSAICCKTRPNHWAGWSTRITITQKRRRKSGDPGSGHGSGDDARDAFALFQPFSQADSTLDRQQGGLGLGLALAKGLAELHGGTSRPTVRTRPGGRVCGAASFGDGEVRSAATECKRHESRRRVLVIEDNIDAADQSRDLLAFDEHEIEVAYKALTELRKRGNSVPRSCCVTLGCRHGWLRGRASVPCRRHAQRCLPVALTGYALPEDLERAQAAGFARHSRSRPAWRNWGRSSPRCRDARRNPC